MRNRTKGGLLRAAAATALAITAAAVVLPTGAMAAEATASANVNVRSGPGTGYSVIDTLSAGDLVDVLGCRLGWCYVEHDGPSGFVSASYLRRGAVTVEPNFNLSFNFPQGSISIRSGGVSFGVGPGGSPAGSMPGDVCFYSGKNYTGSRFCMDRYDMTPYVGAAWNNRISSFRNPDGLRVTVCDDAGYDLCRTYTTSARTLGSLDNRISSIRVR